MARSVEDIAETGAAWVSEQELADLCNSILALREENARLKQRLEFDAQDECAERLTNERDNLMMKTDYEEFRDSSPENAALLDAEERVLAAEEACAMLREEIDRLKADLEEQRRNAGAWCEQCKLAEDKLAKVRSMILEPDRAVYTREESMARERLRADLLRWFDTYAAAKGGE